MSGRREKGRWGRINTKMYGDEFYMRKLSPDLPSGQGLFRYLLTGPHLTGVPGLILLRKLDLCERLGWRLNKSSPWPAWTYQYKFFEATFGKPLLDSFPFGVEELLQTMVDAGKLITDEEAGVGFLPKGIENDTPDNPNTVLSWRHVLYNEVPETPLKWRALRTIHAHLTRARPGVDWDGAFRTLAPKAFAIRALLKGTLPPKVGGKPGGTTQTPNPNPQTPIIKPPPPEQAGALPLQRKHQPVEEENKQILQAADQPQPQPQLSAPPTPPGPLPEYVGRQDELDAMEALYAAKRQAELDEVRADAAEQARLQAEDPDSPHRTRFMFVKADGEIDVKEGWRFIQVTRVNYKTTDGVPKPLRRERIVPNGFGEWVARVIHEEGVDGFVRVVVNYVGDQSLDVAAKEWPTATMMSENIWPQRARPSAKRRRAVGY